MMVQRWPYRLGLDLGANSLGWFVVWLDGEGKAVGLGPGGVRIYPDGRGPQSKTSNAVDRRVARGARRCRVASGYHLKPALGGWASKG